MSPPLISSLSNSLNGFQCIPLIYPSLGMGVWCDPRKQRRLTHWSRPPLTTLIYFPPWALSRTFGKPSTLSDEIEDSSIYRDSFPYIETDTRS